MRAWHSGFFMNQFTYKHRLKVNSNGLLSVIVDFKLSVSFGLTVCSEYSYVALFCLISLMGSLSNFKLV